MRFALGVAAGWLLHRYLLWLDAKAEAILSSRCALDGTLNTRNNVIMTTTKTRDKCPCRQCSPELWGDVAMTEAE